MIPQNKCPALEYWKGIPMCSLDRGTECNYVEDMGRRMYECPTFRQQVKPILDSQRKERMLMREAGWNYV